MRIKWGPNFGTCDGCTHLLTSIRKNKLCKKNIIDGWGKEHGAIESELRFCPRFCTNLPNEILKIFKPYEDAYKERIRLKTEEEVRVLTKGW